MTRLVHLELHTGDLPGAHGFYRRLLGWRFERISVNCRSYLAMDLGHDVGGGIVECAAPEATWLPYVEVGEIGAVTNRARELGAAVLLEPREGPGGWRSVVAAPAAGEIALWQPKGRRQSTRQ